ncbi:MAG: hypothetical protein R3F62_14190 [Planctomycetota bacterium]
MKLPTAALALLATFPALAQEHQGLRPLSPRAFSLGEDPAEWTRLDGLTDELARQLPRASVLQVVADANREGRPLGRSLDGIRIHTGFRWDRGDDAVEYWWPQGISGTAAAFPSESLGGKRILLASWYFKREESSSAVNKGVRVSFVDVTSMQRVRYRHVLLVEPTRDASGDASFRPVPIHAGGIAWVGRYLYAVDTTRGFRVFDTQRILRVSTGKRETIGRSGGRFYAFDYRYVLPQVGAYRLTGASADLRFSFVSVDRSTNPPSLLTGEYVKDAVDGKLARWSFHPVSGLLEGAGAIHPAEVFVANQDRVQGALSWRGRFQLACSSQKIRRFRNHGRLYATAPFTPSAAREWAYGPEDLTFTPSKGNLWSLSEYPGHRAVFAVKWTK